jgi:hypothetical protein
MTRIRTDKYDHAADLEGGALYAFDAQTSLGGATTVRNNTACSDLTFRLDGQCLHLAQQDAEVPSVSNDLRPSRAREGDEQTEGGTHGTPLTHALLPQRRRAVRCGGSATSKLQSRAIRSHGPPA